MGQRRTADSAQAVAISAGHARPHQKVARGTGAFSVPVLNRGGQSRNAEPARDPVREKNALFLAGADANRVLSALWAGLGVQQSQLAGPAARVCVEPVVDTGQPRRGGEIR